MTLVRHNDVISGPFPQWHSDLPLIGRASDFAAVQTALADGHRAIAIVGMSGVGKTRLAVEIAARSPFTNGIIWQAITPQTIFGDLINLIS